MTSRDDVPEIDALVVGAGPVGLAAALELSRRGLVVRLVDAAPGPATTSRAVATHPRTLELYDQMGVVDEMLARGRRISAFTLFQDGRRLARLDADYSSMPTRFPFTLSIEQTATEAVLREALAGHGVRPEWGVRLERFVQDDDSVTVTLAGPAGPVTTTVPWLVGCDGGHSTVRRELGLPLLGDANHTWLLADAPMTTDLPPNSIYWVRTSGGTLMAVPLAGDTWRLLDTAEVDYDGDPDALAARFARKLAVGLGRPVHVGTPSWVSRFTAQQRMVPRMQDGRCFVAGDAAHVHSPASGQGMNTGLQEAVNLAWKIAMVHRGHAGPGLLETYSAERVPVGEALLESTRKAAGFIELRTAFTDLALPVVFGVVSRVAPIRRRMQREMLGGMSGLLLRYGRADGEDPAGGAAPRGGPPVGGRVTEVTEDDLGVPGWPRLLEALRTGGWLLLAADDGSAPGDPHALARLGAQYGAWLTTLLLGAADASPADPGVVGDPEGRVRDRLGLAPGGWLLVRPDGYVHDRGERLDVDIVAAAVAAAHLRGAATARA